MSETDCRSEEGVTVGLIDSLISICRVLSKREMNTKSIQEALCDLSTDEDVNKVLSCAWFAQGYKEGAGEVQYS